MTGLVLLTLFYAALAMDFQPAPPDSKLEAALNRFAEIDKVAQPLFISTFLGKTEEVAKILGSYPQYLSTVLDCNHAIKCPLETAIMRGHYELAKLILAHMKLHIPHTCIDDLFMRWNNPMILNMITRGDKPAVKFILESIIAEYPDGDWSKTKVSRWCPLSYARCMRENDMATYLSELGYTEEPAMNATDTALVITSSDPPKKTKPDGLLTSSDSPKKTPSGSLTPTKSSSKHRFHIDLHIRSRSGSLTASGSPRKSSKSPREKSSLEGGSQSAPESPKTPDTSSHSPRKSPKNPREKTSIGGGSSRSSMSAPESPKTPDGAPRRSSKSLREKTSLSGSRGSLSAPESPKTPDGAPRRTAKSLQENTNYGSSHSSRSASESPKSQEASMSSFKFPKSRREKGSVGGGSSRSSLSDPETPNTVETSNSPRRKSSKSQRSKSSIKGGSSFNSLSATESPNTPETSCSPRRKTSKTLPEKISLASLSMPDSPKDSDADSLTTEESSGSSRTESNTGSSASSDSILEVRKKSSGGLRKRANSSYKK